MVTLFATFAGGITWYMKTKHSSSLFFASTGILDRQLEYYLLESLAITTPHSQIDPIERDASVCRDQTNTSLTFRSVHRTHQPQSRKHSFFISMPPLADILHRTLVLGLLGATVAGVGTGWMVHKDTLKRGQGS